MQTIPEDASSPVVTVHGTRYDYFCGCGYHQLQDLPEIRGAAARALEEWPFKQGPSHYGHQSNPLMEEFIRTATAFFDTETVVSYPSGYMGNTVLLRALRERCNVVLYDQESHHSVMDAVTLSAMPAYPFGHTNPADLRRALADCGKRATGRVRPLIVCDGVFPVTGKISPLPDYIEVLGATDEYTVVVDDSHGTGVLGAHGRGTVEHFGIDSPNLYYTATLSKGLGCHGGVIPCTRSFRDRIAAGRILTGSTELPNATLAASTAALRYLMDKPQLVARLQENAVYFKEGLARLGLPVEVSRSGIATISQLPGGRLESLYDHLKTNGILPLFVPGGSYPGAPVSGSIKFTVFSGHEKRQLDRVLAVLSDWLRSEGKAL